MTDPYVIPTESVVDCSACDRPNTVDIFDDIRTGDWAYLFQCWSCDHINDEHGNSLDRGAISLFALFLISGLFIGAGFILWGALGHSWPVALIGGWLVLGILLYAALFGGNNERTER